MADRVDISVIVDNYIDIFLPPMGNVTYPFPGPASRLLAEQGLSLAVDVWNEGSVIRIIYDFGRSEEVFLHNASLLDINFNDLDYLVLSHGHVDHYGSLQHILTTTGKSRLFAHPEVSGRKRYMRLQNGDFAGPWELKAEILNEFKSRISLSANPSFIASDIIVSGEIERQTDFEKGMPNAFVEVGGDLTHDRIRDDQALFIDLEGRGIVLLTGCCHAGLVNTLLYALKILPGRPVYAVIGGFHLNNADEKQMNETIEYLRSLNIRYLAALHCTGYYAARRLMQAFHDQWIAGTVGAQITMH